MTEAEFTYSTIHIPNDVAHTLFVVLFNDKLQFDAVKLVKTFAEIKIQVQNESWIRVLQVVTICEPKLKFKNLLPLELYNVSLSQLAWNMNLYIYV